MGQYLHRKDELDGWQHEGQIRKCRQLLGCRHLYLRYSAMPSEFASVRGWRIGAVAACRSPSARNWRIEALQLVDAPQCEARGLNSVLLRKMGSPYAFVPEAAFFGEGASSFVLLAVRARMFA